MTVKISQKLKRGEELNQLSRLLFDVAANKWYLAFGLEILAGSLALVLSLVASLSAEVKLYGAALTAVILVVAYTLRQLFEEQYDMAETMRRQSVLTEGLGYNIKSTMFSEWRRRAGKRVLNKFTLAPRNNDYYLTKRKASPRRLLEMTQESAFWTRLLYSSLLKYISLILVIVLAMLATITLAILLGTVPNSVAEVFTYGLLLAIPLILSLNVIGWYLKLQRLIQSICEIEKGYGAT